MSLAPWFSFSGFYRRFCLFVAGFLSFVFVSSSFAVEVEEGFNLVRTAPGDTLWFGFEWEGVSIGAFDFGDGNGSVDVGDADTIIERKEPAEVDPAPDEADPIDIEIIELQLRSVDPIDMGAGSDYHFITLSDSNVSAGVMDIAFADGLGGTFDSLAKLFFDVRIGSLAGAIVQSGSVELAIEDIAWSRNPVPNSVQIAGVNVNLNGVDSSADFWTGIVPFDNTGAAVYPARIPDASNSLLLFSFALLALFGVQRFRTLLVRK